MDLMKSKPYFPDLDWLVRTEAAKEFYEKIGFTLTKGIFLSIPCKWVGYNLY